MRYSDELERGGWAETRRGRLGVKIVVEGDPSDRKTRFDTCESGRRELLEAEWGILTSWNEAGGRKRGEGGWGENCC